MTAAQIRRQVVLTVTEGDGGLTLKHLRGLVTAANDAVLDDDTPVMIPNDTGGSKQAAWVTLDGMDERPTVHEGGGRGRRATPAVWPRGGPTGEGEYV